MNWWSIPLYALALLGILASGLWMARPSPEAANESVGVRLVHMDRYPAPPPRVGMNHWNREIQSPGMKSSTTFLPRLATDARFVRYVHRTLPHPSPRSAHAASDAPGGAYTPSGRWLTHLEIEEHLAVLSPEYRELFFAICGAESGWRDTRGYRQNDNGTWDWGPCQLNSRHFLMPKSYPGCAGFPFPEAARVAGRAHMESVRALVDCVESLGQPAWQPWAAWGDSGAILGRVYATACSRTGDRGAGRCQPRD